MRHLQLSKSLFRSINAVPVLRAAFVSLGAAGHTLTVRALQLTALANATVGVQYAPVGEREAVYPVKSYAGRSSLNTFVNTARVLVSTLADNHSVQLAQVSNTGEYHLRYTRCGLTDEMRVLNDTLPEFDFDPFTANLTVRCVRSSKARQEVALRLAGLPIRIGNQSRDVK